MTDSGAPPIDWQDPALHPAVVEALIFLSAYGRWVKGISQHRRDRRGWCSGHNTPSPWPCAAYQLADAARRLNEDTPPPLRRPPPLRAVSGRPR